MPKPIIKSSVRHRTPSPISEMDNPVQSVLEGMRVQRMSLVQSLRQFVFVHRGESECMGRGGNMRG
jgi:protein-tyrosine phosphatase